MTGPTVAHVITSLDIGGAEMVLYRLLVQARDRMGKVFVIGVRNDGPVADMIRDLGVPVTTLGLSKNAGQFLAVDRVAALLRSSGAEVVQTWMYHADVLGGFAARRAKAGVVWGVHAGAPVEGRAGIRMNLGARVCGLLSHRVPDRIVCASRESFDVHCKLGYVKRKMVLIPNGFGGPTVDRGPARQKLLEALGLEADVRLVIRVARLHPVKDHPGLLRAIRIVVDQNPSVHLLLVGEGMSPDEPELSRTIGDLDLGEHVHLLGARTDVAELVAGCDLAVSSSRVGEGLPLVVGEAMEAGTPVVATDVGDCARLIDDPARVPPAGRPEQLGAGMQRVLDLNRVELDALGGRDRARVREEYGIQRMADAYANLYEQVLTERSDD